MRVALLTNFVPPYRVPVFRALRDRVGDLRVFASTAMERNRTWSPQWADLDVVVQRTWTLRRSWSNERYSESYELHVPYDTVPRLAAWRPDVILSGELGLRTGQALAYAKAAGRPIVLWATLADHIERNRDRLRTVWRRGLIRFLDRVIVNGESGARYVRSIGAAEDRIVRVPQAIETGPFTALPLERAPDASRRLLYCGAVSELKGSDLLVEGVALWGRRNPDRRIALTVVGSGPLRGPLGRAMLPTNVTIDWVGPVEYGELPACYARCGILLFPTRGDEWGLVVNEAMASGMPVIGSEYSQAVDELVADGGNGWRFLPRDADAVARAVSRAMETPDDVLSEMRASARATAMRITPDDVAGRIASVLRDASAAPAAASGIPRP